MSTAGVEDPRRPGVRDPDTCTTYAAGNAGRSHQFQQRAELGQLLNAARQIHEGDLLLVSGFRSRPYRTIALHLTTTCRAHQCPTGLHRRGHKSTTTSL